jgi:hypothetical protein
MRCRIIVAAKNSADLLQVAYARNCESTPSLTDRDFDNAVRLALRDLIQESAA